MFVVSLEKVRFTFRQTPTCVFRVLSFNQTRNLAHLQLSVLWGKLILYVERKQTFDVYVLTFDIRTVGLSSYKMNAQPLSPS